MNENLLETLKSYEEDFEWYPTTRKMLEIIAKDICLEFREPHHDSLSFSILDIGAGNGNALQIICEISKNEGEKYAIEKSKILVDALPADVFVIGTDFHQQTLIDKEVDVVFCNPPYSEYEIWMQRIIAEANSRLVYMIVPERWKDNKAIIEMIERRCGGGLDNDEINGKAIILDSTSFENSEYRKARAKINIVRIRFQDTYQHKIEVDPFDIWFETNFKINADNIEDVKDQEAKVQQLHNLIKGQNLIERLEELYRDDFDELKEIYRALEKLDCSLFKELGVDLAQIKGGLKSKISGLKNLYWQELFNNLEAITSRLTLRSRERLLKKLTAHTSIDFTATNAYAVVVWAIKNANAYFDAQLLELYLDISNSESIHNYKSNKKLIEDGWRYQRQEHTHYILDYRLVINRYSCFPSNTWSSYDYPMGLNKSIHDLLGDICTIAKNLGFDIKTNSFDFKWSPGEQKEFRLSNGLLFMDVRAYKKGTIHIRCDQNFMKKLNIEAGRINGWIKTPVEAEEETGIQNVADIFGINFKLKSIKLLENTLQKD